MKIPLVLGFVAITPYTLFGEVMGHKDGAEGCMWCDALFVEGNSTEGYLHRLLIY